MIEHRHKKHIDDIPDFFACYNADERAVVLKDISVYEDIHTAIHHRPVRKAADRIFVQGWTQPHDGPNLNEELYGKHQNDQTYHLRLTVPFSQEVRFTPQVLERTNSIKNQIDGNDFIIPFYDKESLQEMIRTVTSYKRAVNPVFNEHSKLLTYLNLMKSGISEPIYADTAIVKGTHDPLESVHLNYFSTLEEINELRKAYKLTDNSELLNEDRDRFNEIQSNVLIHVGDLEELIGHVNHQLLFTVRKKLQPLDMLIKEIVGTHPCK